MYSAISARSEPLSCLLSSNFTLVQMFHVEQRISGKEVASNQKSFNIDDFIWPHGTTPPLHHTRRRRFRRRVNKRTIEIVEQEVARLLEQDALPQDVKYGTSLRDQSLFLLSDFTL
jgi:TATA-binding protein-associated factor Taf7